ncbi:hypothetical protein SprV_0100128800 [Sparganum proliferum]
MSAAVKGFRMSDSEESSMPYPSDAANASVPERRPNSNRLAGYRSLFDCLSRRKTNTIPISTLKYAFQMEAQAPTEMELKEIKKAYVDTTLEDPENTPVDFETFCTIMEENSLNSSDRLNKLLSALITFDETSRGSLHADNFHKQMLILGDRLSETEAVEFMKDAQPGEDGYISYLDFAHRMVEGHPPSLPKKAPRDKGEAKSARMAPSVSMRASKSGASLQSNQQPGEEFAFVVSASA